MHHVGTAAGSPGRSSSISSSSQRSSIHIHYPNNDIGQHQHQQQQQQQQQQQHRYHHHYHHHHHHPEPRSLQMVTSATFVRCNRFVRQMVYHCKSSSNQKFLFVFGLTALIFLSLVAVFGGTIQNHGASSLSPLPTVLTSTTNLKALNRALKQKSLDQVLQWAHQVTDNGKQLLPVSSFGPSGLVILHKMQQLGLLHKVVSIDTLHLFPETYTFIEKSWKQHAHVHAHANIRGARDDDDDDDDLQLLIYKPQGFETQQAFDAKYGSDLYKTDPDRYAYLSKVEPLQRALTEHQTKIWITGRRKSQGGERTQLEILELDDSVSSPALPTPPAPPPPQQQQQQRWKLNPLAYWSLDDVWTYIRKHNIPYNPLHDQGYPSIGDVMTTSRSPKGGGERSGRFMSLGHGNQTECGIHSTRAKLEKMKQAAAAAAASKQTIEQGDNMDGAKLKGFLIGQTKNKGKQHAKPQEEEQDDTRPLPCTGCLELDPGSLKHWIATGTADLLIEFHSPLCGHCRQFAPTYEQVALALHGVTEIQVARFDVTYHNVPKSTGMIVEATPELYLIRRLPDYKIIKYQGPTTRSHVPILQWLASQTDYVHL